MSMSQPGWFDLLPADLRGRAYMVGNEAAWSREDAIAVINRSASQSLQILGVEVWLPTTPGPTVPGPYVWDSSASGAQETDSTKQTQAAIRFIRSFEWDVDDVDSQGHEPYFNLTFA